MNKKVYETIEKIKQKNSNEYFESLMAYEKIIIIGQNNNGYITSKQVSAHNISREYIRLLEKKGAIQKVERGIYILKEVIPDDFYIFQLKYPKTIFSHSTALYFHGLTEELPYRYDITCPRNYNVKSIKNNNLYYVDNNFINLGKIKIQTKYGNQVNIYDIERTICDIIRNENRMDEEQKNKTIRKLVDQNKIDMHKLTDYSKKLKCHEKVMKEMRYYDV